MSHGIANTLRRATPSKNLPNYCNNNVGSICFLSLRSLKNSIQPTTSLLSPNSQNENVLFSYKYFIDESYSQNVDLLAIIYPSLNFDNTASNYQSFIELFAQNDFLTCFIDELEIIIKCLKEVL